MNIRVFSIILVLIYCCSACSHPKSEAKQISVEKQSYVRWHEKEKELEVYIPVSNLTDHDVSFEASIIFLNIKLQESVGLEADQLKTDDRNNNSPFHLIANNETVFKRTYKTHSPLTKEMLAEGVGIEFVIQKQTYTTAIKYSEVK